MKRIPTRRKCRKLAYPNERAAKRALYRQKANGLITRSTLGVYRCPHCPGRVYHLGNAREGA